MPGHFAFVDANGIGCPGFCLPQCCRASVIVKRSASKALFPADYFVADGVVVFYNQVSRCSALNQEKQIQVAIISIQ
jgi:hypothetical protein